TQESLAQGLAPGGTGSTYGEDLVRTDIDKISLLRTDRSLPGGEDFDRPLAEMERAAVARDSDETVRCIWELIEADQRSAATMTAI
ncbi:MAG: hypothetical protein HN341_04665, partial [Verrucomicrobia bacterium]|nr:hypothetical protein [Verrucomicrobiota bacterium]